MPPILKLTNDECRLATSSSKPYRIVDGGSLGLRITPVEGSSGDSVIATGKVKGNGANQGCLAELEDYLEATNKDAGYIEDVEARLERDIITKVGTRVPGDVKRVAPLTLRDALFKT